MKIRRLYEDVHDDIIEAGEREEMKYKAAEEYISNNLKGSKLNNFNNLQNEYFETKKEILKLLNEYTEIRDKEDPEDHGGYWLGQYGFDHGDINKVEIVNHQYFGRCLKINVSFSNEDFYMRSVDFQNFLRYVEDAETFKNMKKFNL